MKTNAVRLLEKAGIPFELRQYRVSEAALSAEQVARVLGMAPECVFKTLIAIGDRSGPLLALVPAGTELDLRKLAQVSHNRRVELAPQREVLALTGYERGAVTPLGIHHAYPVFIDETVILWHWVGISGGAMGLEILIAPQDLLRITRPQLADIARSAP